MQNMQKNKKIEFEYKKLITEYNALLLTLASATIGFGVFLFTLTKNIASSIIGFVLFFIIVNDFKEEKSKQIKRKINEFIE